MLDQRDTASIAAGSGGIAARDVLPAGAPATRCFEIPAEVQRQADALDYLAERLDLLAGRLAPITRPENPQPAAGTTAVDVATDLARTLEVHTTRIKIAAARVSDLIERLEI